MICERTPEELIRDITQFHGFVAPGLLIGAFMVDLAQKHLPTGCEADAIVETRHCLPDAIQIFTPCTIGNAWLKVLDLGKFALTLYDRHTHDGIRVWLDLDKAKDHMDVYSWFMGIVSKRDLPIDVLISAIFRAGPDILSFEEVTVTRHAERAKKDKTRVCPKCNEAYSSSQGSTCFACQGQAYYEQTAESMMTSQ